MHKEDFRLFPTLVSRYKNFLTQAQADNIFLYCKNSNHQQHGAWIGNATSSHHTTKNILEDIEKNVEHCQGLVYDLTFCVNMFGKSFGYHKDLQIFNSWFNIQNPGSVLKMHTHPQSIFSAALFVRCDDQSSPLVFENPNSNLHYLNSALEGYVDGFNGVSVHQNFVFQPSIGDLILFPAWLKHGSAEQINQGTERMSISFNCRF